MVCDAVCVAVCVAGCVADGRETQVGSGFRCAVGRVAGRVAGCVAGCVAVRTGCAAAAMGRCGTSSDAVRDGLGRGAAGAVGGGLGRSAAGSARTRSGRTGAGRVACSSGSGQGATRCMGAVARGGWL